MRDALVQTGGNHLQDCLSSLQEKPLTYMRWYLAGFLFIQGSFFFDHVYIHTVPNNEKSLVSSSIFVTKH